MRGSGKGQGVEWRVCVYGVCVGEASVMGEGVAPLLQIRFTWALTGRCLADGLQGLRRRMKGKASGCSPSS